MRLFFIVEKILGILGSVHTIENRYKRKMNKLAINSTKQQIRQGFSSLGNHLSSEQALEPEKERRKRKENA